jgi:hypothetical protein
MMSKRVNFAYSGEDGIQETARKSLKKMAGERGFEPPTPWFRTAFWHFLKTGVFGKGFGMIDLQKVSLGAESKNLKMRRLPPTKLPTVVLNNNEVFCSALFGHLDLLNF